MKLDDLGYLEEIDRERNQGMQVCRCSNCDPKGAARVIRMLPHTRAADLSSLLQSSSTEPEDTSLFSISPKGRKRKAYGTIPMVCKRDDEIRLKQPWIDLAVGLVGNFERLFMQTYKNESHMLPETLFSREEAWQIVKNYAAVANGVFLREILGGETLPGMFSTLIHCIHTWFGSKSFIDYRDELENIEIDNDQEILNNELLEIKYQEEQCLKISERKLKSNQIAERKNIRLDKSAQAARLKEQNQNKRRLELSCKTMRV